MTGSSPHSHTRAAAGGPDAATPASTGASLGAAPAAAVDDDAARTPAAAAAAAAATADAGRRGAVTPLRAVQGEANKVFNAGVRGGAGATVFGGGGGAGSAFPTGMGSRSLSWQGSSSASLAWDVSPCGGMSSLGGRALSPFGGVFLFWRVLPLGGGGVSPLGGVPFFRAGGALRGVTPLGSLSPVSALREVKFDAEFLLL